LHDLDVLQGALRLESAAGVCANRMHLPGSRSSNILVPAADVPLKRWAVWAWRWRSGDWPAGVRLAAEQDKTAFHSARAIHVIGVVMAAAVRRQRARQLREAWEQWLRFFRWWQVGIPRHAQLGIERTN
jgi:hypothetical protein